MSGKCHKAVVALTWSHSSSFSRNSSRSPCSDNRNRSSSRSNSSRNPSDGSSSTRLAWHATAPVVVLYVTPEATHATFVAKLYHVKLAISPVWLAITPFVGLHVTSEAGRTNLGAKLWADALGLPSPCVYGDWAVQSG